MLRNEENGAPGVTEVMTVRRSDIGRWMAALAQAGLPVAVNAPMRRIRYIGKPTLRRETTVEHGVEKEKTTLELRTRERIAQDGTEALVVGLANGEHWLIGGEGTRDLKVSCTETAGTPGGDAAARTYKIEHTGLRSGVRCLP